MVALILRRLNSEKPCHQYHEMVHLNKEKTVCRKADLHLCLQRKGPAKMCLF